MKLNWDFSSRSARTIALFGLLYQQSLEPKTTLPRRPPIMVFPLFA